MIRVLIADDSATIRSLLVAILEDDPEIQVIGEAVDGETAIRMTAELRPDVLTMDIHMPGLDGFQATKEIMSESPTPIIIVSSAVTEEAVGASLDATRAGALMALPTPDPLAGRFEEDVENLRAMVRAMAGMKVLRRRGRGRELPVRPPPAPEAVEVIAIAASTGGPAALHRILVDLPRNFSVPILVVQHIARDFVPGLCSWLNAHCNLCVRIAEQGAVPEPGSVYVAPDDRHLGVRERGVLQLSAAPVIGGFRPSGSYLFESVARSYGRSMVAVVLTGMGRDGAEGTRAVRAAGGTVLAQDAATSVVHGMPAEVVRIGMANRVLPLDRIAPTLVDLIHGGGSGIHHPRG